MKNIFKFLTVAVFGLSLVSCKGFLDEKITTSFATEHMYATEASLNADITGCYETFATAGFLYGPMHEWLQPASGILHWGGSANRWSSIRYTAELNFTRASTQDVGYWSFSNFHSAAYVSNALLGAIKSSTAPENVKRFIEGEGQFVRAVSYFYLVRLYGDTSCAKVPPTSVAEVCTTRTNFWEIYNFILEDLTEAFEKMASYDEMIAMVGGNASGRVCNYGALAMRSLVFLTIGTLLAHPDDNIWLADKRTPKFEYPKGTSLTAEKCFEHALKDAEEVINKGPFELAKSYAQLFRWGGRDKNNPGQYPEDFQLKERIFVIPRTAEGVSNTSLSMWSLPAYYNGNSSSTYARTIPTRWFFQTWCGAYGGVKGSDSDNSDIYIDCGDPRMKASFAYGSYIGQKDKATAIYPTTGMVNPKSSSTSENYKINALFSIKYYDATFNKNTGLADLYLMRFAEVYLIAAEAAAYLSENIGDENWNKAIGHVNTLLDRARKSGDGVAPNVTLNYEGNGTCAEPANWTTDKFSSKEDLLTAIFWERCFELNFECHEYFDTHRCGAQWIIDHISKPKNAFLDKQHVNYVVFHYGTGYPATGMQSADGKAFRYSTDPAIVRKGLLSAYPNDELISNIMLDPSAYHPNLGQNPMELFWQ